jgi:hypothetical protein
MSSRRALFLLIVLSTLTALVRAGSVLVVDAAAGPCFDIQPAVDAAVHGDVALVRSGDYATFVVASRSVAVVADTGALVNVQGAVLVRNLDAGETCVFAGLRATGNHVESFDRYGFSGLPCAGSIRIQDCGRRVI